MLAAVLTVAAPVFVIAALGMAYFFVNSISQYTLGLAISSGHFHPAQRLKQPVIWAVLVVVTVLATDVSMPRWFNATTSILGGLTIPAMLLMLGTSLANLNIAAVRETLSIAAPRLGFGFGFGLSTREPLHKSQKLRGTGTWALTF